MFIETLSALAALATIGGFVIDVAEKIHRWAKGASARKRMEREGKHWKVPENN